MIVPECSDFNDDLIAIVAGTLAARIAPLVASTQPAATAGERLPDHIFMCIRSWCLVPLSIRQIMMLERLPRESGVETPTAENLARLERKRSPNPRDRYARPRTRYQTGAAEVGGDEARRLAG